MKIEDSPSASGSRAGMDVDRGDVRPLLGKQPGRGRADARRGPADPGSLSCQPVWPMPDQLLDPGPFFLETGAVEYLRIDHPPRHFAERQVDHPLADRPADVAEQLVGPGNAVRRQQHVVELAEAMRPDDRLVREAIEGRAGDPPLSQRLVKSSSSSTMPPRAVLIR